MTDNYSYDQNDNELPPCYEGLNQCLNISEYSSLLDGIEGKLIPPSEVVDANAAMRPRRVLETESKAKVRCLGITFTFKTFEETDGVTERIDNGIEMNPTLAINWHDRPVCDKNGNTRAYHVRAAVPLLSAGPLENLWQTDFLLFELDPSLQQWGKGGLTQEMLDQMEVRGFRRNIEGAKKVVERGNSNPTDRTVLVAIPKDEVQFFVQFYPNDYERINASSLIEANEERYAHNYIRYERPDVPGVG